MPSLTIPADVPVYTHQEYRKNYTLLTKDTGNLFLFSADHKIEHLDSDFHGPSVPPEAHDPKHLFSLAQVSPIGGMASQLGLIARYGHLYPEIPYVIKLNSKTNIIPKVQQDPLSSLLWTVDDVIQFKESSGLTIPGVGITVYLGSEYEPVMLEQAAQEVLQAHRHGLIAIIWMYPRGKAITDEQDPHLLAGAVGVAASLGADFVKIHLPQDEKLLSFIAQAAGTTKVICAGGSYKEKKVLLGQIQKALDAGFSGAAIGRSLFQNTHKDAVSLAQELAEIIY